MGEQLWLQISEPTEKDKGKYAIEFFDGKGGLRRTVELAGQGEETHYHTPYAHVLNMTYTNIYLNVHNFIKQCNVSVYVKYSGYDV